MDVYSGAVHVVDDVMYDMLDYTLEPFMAEAKCPDYIKEGLKDKYSEEELEESYAEICALVNAGCLQMIAMTKLRRIGISNLL